ncbi:MAG TPA: hypothetical protein VF414_16870, partial [Thermoanaerobaculia bacterium]
CWAFVRMTILATHPMRPPTINMMMMFIPILLFVVCFVLRFLFSPPPLNKSNCRAIRPGGGLQ